MKGGRRVAEIDNFCPSSSLQPADHADSLLRAFTSPRPLPRTDLDMNGIIHTCTHGDAVRRTRDSHS